MASESAIEWTDATWNVVTGCSLVSPACTNCYAMRLAGTRLAHLPSRRGLTREVNGKHVWTGEVRFNEAWLTQPLEWKRPRKIFVAAHGDLFHESVPDEWIDLVFAVMALAPQHTFQVLTKRPARMREYLASDRRFEWSQAHAPGTLPKMSAHQVDAWLHPQANPEHRALYRAELVAYPLPNVWLGVTAEDQSRADERIPDLLATPAAFRFISCEPLLGSIALHNLPLGKSGHVNALTGEMLTFDGDYDADGARLDLVITGGESGPTARPTHPDWFRGLRDQCSTAGVPFLFKQWGEWGEPTDDLGALDWPYHRDHNRTHWFDSRVCVRPAAPFWSDKYTVGGGAFPPPPFDLFATPEYLEQVALCPQTECREAGKCIGNKSRAAVTWRGKKLAGRLLDGREHNGRPEAGR